MHPLVLKVAGIPDRPWSQHGLSMLAGASNGSCGTEGAKAADISKPFKTLQDLGILVNIPGSYGCLPIIWNCRCWLIRIQNRWENGLLAGFYVDSMVLPEASNARSESLLLGVPRGHLWLEGVLGRDPDRGWGSCSMFLDCDGPRSNPTNLMQNGSTWGLPASGRWFAFICLFVDV